MSLGPEIRDILFTPVRLREGYDMGEVDAFLDALAAASDRGESLRSMVDHVRFTPVRLREGYDMGEVDLFLARMASGTRATSGAAPAPVADPPPRPVIEERRGVLARWFGRGA